MISAVAIAVGPGIIALWLGGYGAAVVTFAIFSAVNLVVYFGWIWWDARPRRLRFEFVWMAVLLGVLLVVFLTDAFDSGLRRAVVGIAPAVAIILIVLGLRQIFGTRTRSPTARKKAGG